MSKVDKLHAYGLLMILIPSLTVAGLGHANDHLTVHTGVLGILAIPSGLFGVYLIGRGQRLQKNQTVVKEALRLQQRFTETFNVPPDPKNAVHIAPVRKHIDSLRNAIYESMEQLRTLDERDVRLKPLSRELQHRQQQFSDAVNLALEFDMGA